MKLYCPHCGLRFNEWFVWEGLMYCWPCYNERGQMITEEEGVKRPVIDSMKARISPPTDIAIIAAIVAIVSFATAMSILVIWR